jgi:hypothetical protein
MAVGSYLTESADERIWRTLPSEISIARARIAPGAHTIVLQTPSGPQSAQINIAGRYAVVGLRLLHNHLFLQSPLPAPADAPAPSTSASPATLEEPMPATEVHR